MFVLDLLIWRWCFLHESLTILLQPLSKYQGAARRLHFADDCILYFLSIAPSSLRHGQEHHPRTSKLVPGNVWYGSARHTTILQSRSGLSLSQAYLPQLSYRNLQKPNQVALRSMLMPSCGESCSFILSDHVCRAYRCFDVSAGRLISSSISD